MYYGFGYDDANDDYKVVGIAKRYSQIKVWVYSLKADSWRLAGMISSQGPCCFIPEISVLLDNHLVHWFCKFHFSSDQQQQLRCFNLRSETWAAIVLLPEVNNLVVTFRGS